MGANQGWRGIVVGAIVQNGSLGAMRLLLNPEDYYYFDGPKNDPNEDIGKLRTIVDGEEMGDSKCIVLMTKYNISSANCAVCSSSS